MTILLLIFRNTSFILLFNFRKFFAKFCILILVSCQIAFHLAEKLFLSYVELINNMIFDFVLKRVVLLKNFIFLYFELCQSFGFTQIPKRFFFLILFRVDEAFDFVIYFIDQIFIFIFQVFIHNILMILVFAKNNTNLTYLSIISFAIIFKRLIMSFTQLHILKV